MRKFIVALVSVLALSLAFPVGVSAATDLLNKACTEGNSASSSAACKDKNDVSNPLWGWNGVLTKVTRMLIVIVAIVSVIVIIIAGIQFVLGQGDPSKVTSSRNTIIYALVGLFVAVIGQSIVVLVLNKL
jgi:fumarate reductase subunit D